MPKLIIVWVTLVVTIFMFRCKPSREQVLDNAEKDALFDIYRESLDKNPELSVRSILEITKHRVNIDTIAGINKGVWNNYGKALALFHNKLPFDAVDLINRILATQENDSTRFERAVLLQLRGNIFQLNSRNQAAAEDFYDAADNFMKAGLFLKAASCFIEIGDIQFNSGNYRLSVQNSSRGVSLYVQNKISRKDSIQLMNAYNTLGLSYFKVKQLDSALMAYDKGLIVARNLREEFWEGLISGNSSKIYLARGMKDQAIERINIDIKASLKFNDFRSATGALMSMGDILVSEKDLPRSKFYYDSARQLLKKITNPKTHRRYYQSMATWYQLKGNYKKAFWYFQKHLELRDSIELLQNGLSLQQMHNQKQFEKQLADMNLLRAENELKKKEVRLWELSITGALIGFILVSALLYVNFRSNKELNQLNLQLENKVKLRTSELLKTNKELDTYLYRASHDVRRPILSIIGLTQIVDLTSDELERSDIHKKIRSTAYDMDKMLNKLQMAYELDKENDYQDVNLKDYLVGLADTFKLSYPLVNFFISPVENATIETNVKLLDMAVSNILENACIFSNRTNPEVYLKIELTEYEAFITIRDNGIGIDDKFLKQIFHAYTRFSNRSIGSGLGLHLANKSMRKLGGIIRVRSTLHIGSEFILSLPVHPEVLST